VEALLRNQLDRLRRAHFVLLQRAAQAVGHSGASRCPGNI
jgi:hypothetical protein